jgi:hypothetical protein
MRQIRDLKKPWEYPEPVGQVENGWTIVRVQTPWDYGLETYFLDHCLGTKHFEAFEKGHRVFSLRDEYEVPHCTILCLKPGFVSAYAAFADLGTTQRAELGGEELHVLQVRGRHDNPAGVKYLKLVRSWFLENLGREYEGIEPEIVDMHNLVFGDKDDQYHHAYILNEDERIYEGAWVGADPTGGRGWLSL